MGGSERLKGQRPEQGSSTCGRGCIMAVFPITSRLYVKVLPDFKQDRVFCNLEKIIDEGKLRGKETFRNLL